MSRIIKSVDCPHEIFSLGQTLFAEGTTGECFYLVQKGDVGIYKGHGTPNEVLLGHVPAGRVLGEIACIDHRPRTATAIALTEVEVTKISAKTLAWQINECPAWFAGIVRDLVERLRATDELYAQHPHGHLAQVTSMTDASQPAAEPGVANRAPSGNESIPRPD